MRYFALYILTSLLISASTLEQKTIVEYELVASVNSGCNEYTIWYIDERYKSKKFVGSLIEIQRLGFSADKVVELSNK